MILILVLPFVFLILFLSIVVCILISIRNLDELEFEEAILLQQEKLALNVILKPEIP